MFSLRLSFWSPSLFFCCLFYLFLVVHHHEQLVLVFFFLSLIIVLVLPIKKKGSTGVSFWSAHLHQTQWVTPCGLDVAACASPDQICSQHGPIQSEMVQNTTQYGPKYFFKKKSINFKLFFYLVLVSNFWYFILIYEHRVMVMYSLYYLLLLLNWCMFTIILKKMLSNYRKYK